MMFELLGAWPISNPSTCVPAGTLIDGNDPNWNGTPLPIPLPMNAKALDQDAADALGRWYPHHFHLLHTANGIKPKRSFIV